MRFKLDENLPVELVTDLRDMGHDADTVAGEGLRGAADPAVVDAAFAATLDKGIANLQRALHNMIELWTLPLSDVQDVAALFA